MQCFPAHTPLNYLYILTLPIIEHIKGGGGRVLLSIYNNTRSDFRPHYFCTVPYQKKYLAHLLLCILL